MQGNRFLSSCIRQQSQPENHFSGRRPTKRRLTALVAVHKATVTKDWKSNRKYDYYSV